MKNFTREYSLFSLCGLNCGLCTMHIGGYCPGCGGGDGNQSCSIARCSVEHGVTFCSLCGEYPCGKYDGIDEYDSFVTHLHQKQDLEKLRRIGIDAYKIELDEKIAMLHILLEQYNDGRHKSFFCTAVNLLELDSLRRIMKQCKAEVTPEMTMKERAVLVTAKLNTGAQAQGISLKMRKKK